MVTVRDETLPAAVHVRAAAVPEVSRRFKTTTMTTMWSCDTEQRCRQALALSEGFDQADASPDQFGCRRKRGGAPDDRERRVDNKCLISTSCCGGLYY